LRAHDDESAASGSYSAHEGIAVSFRLDVDNSGAHAGCNRRRPIGAAIGAAVSLARENVRFY
jgi:hypothetical protein